jgi:3-deoxy-D-manno-octulosonic-acid transferase
MPRLLYSLLLYVLTPLLALRLLWRARRQPDYLRHLGERLGLAPRQSGPVIWVHAVSVGETRAAAPLIAALLAAWPQHRLLLTGMTPTGRATASALYADEPRIAIAYAPYDWPGACRRFFARSRPAFGVLLETELWPNLLAAAATAGVPMALVNARLSARSARGYARFAGLSRPALASLAAIAAQSPADIDRLLACGARQASLCGNLKFDVQPAPALLDLGRQWRAQLGRRPVWLVASSRDGEEEIVLQAFAQLRASQPDALLLLVPRHPQRFDEVAALIAEQGFSCQRRSQGLPADRDAVWLGDSMGEMAAYYAAADLALIGGSLLPFGGQNLIEAAACGCPLLLGPHTFNFSQAAADALAAGAARPTDIARLATDLTQLLADRPALQAMQAAALAFAGQHQGATEKTLAVLRQMVAEQPSATN